MNTAFDRKKGRRECCPKGVSQERQTREQKKSGREEKEKMTVFTKGKSSDDLCFVFCSVEPHFLTVRNLKVTLMIPGTHRWKE